MSNATENAGPTVLLIDDDPVILRSLDRALTDHDITVETASCAAEAQVCLQRYTFDAIVCDYNMPGKSGLDFLTDVREKNRDVAMFLLSGKVAGLEVAENWAREISVTHVFAKPCDSDLIAAAIFDAYWLHQKLRVHCWE